MKITKNTKITAELVAELQKLSEADMQAVIDLMTVEQAVKVADVILA